MTHLEVLLSVLSLVGLASLIARFSGQSFAYSILYAQFAVIVALYLAGLAQLLELSANAIRIVGLLSLIAIGLPDLISNPKAMRRHANIYLLIALSGFYFLTLTINYFSFAQIDDYSHWGRISRVIASNDRFVVSDDNFGVRDYPPGLALIHYFYTNFAGYKDSLALYSQGVLVLSCLVLPFELLDNRRKNFSYLGFSLVFLSGLSLTWIFYFGLHTLWADLPLGILFGLLLLIWFTSKDPEIIRILKVSPIILCMPLIKQMGLVFVMISALILTADLLFNHGKNSIPRLLLGLATIIVVAFVIDSSWNSYLSGQGIQRTFRSNFGMIEVLKAFIPTYSSLRQQATIEAFFNHFFGKTHFTTYWILLAVLAAIAAYKSSPNEKKFTVAMRIGSAFAGLLLYLILLLVLYMFSFSELEGTRLASINRYTNTYLLGLLLGFGGLFVSNACSEINWKYKRQWIAVVAFLFIAPNLGRVVNDVGRGIKGSEAPYLASQIRSQAEKVNMQTPANAKIYFLWAGGSNDESVIFNYSVAPRTSNTSCSNIRPKSTKIDDLEPSTCWLDFVEIESLLSNYEYVFLGRASEELQALIFEPMGLSKVASGELYLISREPGGLRLGKSYPQ